MNAHLLIDAVVQQTMVFVAALATAGGVRAPLAHVLRFHTVVQAGEPPDASPLYFWRVYVPPTVTSFTLPTLPQSFGLPPVDPLSVQVGSISYGASDTKAGYRDFRNLGRPYGMFTDNLDLLDGRGSAEMMTWSPAP